LKFKFLTFLLINRYKMKESKVFEKCYIPQKLKSKKVKDEKKTAWNLFDYRLCFDLHCPLIERSKHVKDTFICNGYNLAKHKTEMEHRDATPYSVK